MNKPLITDDEAFTMIWKVIDNFDIEKAHAYYVLTNWKVQLNQKLVVPTAEDLRNIIYGHLSDSYKTAKSSYAKNGIFQCGLFSAGILATWCYTNRLTIGCRLDFVIVDSSEYTSSVG